ncbi:hypothetical protein CMU55_19450 [Elizabethkingia anophelis]|nr:hypothetical protein [Elizabethkingia anophelis]
MLNELSQQIYEQNEDKGFYEDGNKLRTLVANEAPELMPVLENLITGQRIALITSEASEALEADRKNKSVNEVRYFDEAWKNTANEVSDETFKHSFEGVVKDTMEDEIADILIRVLDFCGANNIDIDFHVQAKLRYNSLRPYKHGKNY